MLDSTIIPLDEFAHVLAFDFGTRWIGIAVGQRFTCQAQPLTTLQVHKNIIDWTFIKDVIQEWRPACLVVGVPLNMNGSEQSVTPLARAFIKQLEERFTLPVYACDERLSTKAARADLFDIHGSKGLKKAAIDSYAAKLILETWLDMHQFTDK